MNIETRQATSYDAVDILKLLGAMHEESPLRLSTIHPGKALSRINGAINDGYVEVATNDGYIVGAIGGVESQDWWSVARVLGDLFFYVAPECRKSNAAKLLMTAFVDAAKRAKVDELKVGTAVGEDLERKEAWFLRMGFIKGGSHFVLTRGKEE